MRACVGVGVLGAAAPGALVQHKPGKPLFKISLAQWSLNRTIRAGEMSHLEFITAARERFDIDAIEYVSQFFSDKGGDFAYAREMNRRAMDAGVDQLLIMVDGEGRLGDPDPTARRQAVENHVKWIESAVMLGCRCIRVNAGSEGSREEQAKLVADGLHRLATIAEASRSAIVVENHGGLSSDGAWLADVIRRVAHPRCGTLPDFGNFCLDYSKQDDPSAWYDRYQGVRELMPFALAVSAKSYDFDDAGDETTIDYERMMRIVTEAGYRGYVGIEYEGARLGEIEGVLATKRLLERVRGKLGPTFTLPSTPDRSP